MPRRQFHPEVIEIHDSPPPEAAGAIRPLTWVPRVQSYTSCAVQISKSRLAGLSPTESKLLRLKQRKLRLEVPDTLAELVSKPEHHQRSLASTLIFAQEEAGTALCISPSGLVLTCAHCVAENQEEYQAFESRWLLFYTGLAVQVKCLAWDPGRDLALLQIVRLEVDAPVGEGLVPKFTCIPIMHSNPKPNSGIYCIGQPGRDDLESSTARKTLYKLVEISHGRYRGLIKGVDPQDNSEIGALKHDAWTYWGHSGAPLLGATLGELCGLHSSWDDQTTMRHGVPGVAVREFLRRWAESRSDEIGNEVRGLL